jgi:hypothetical protein
MRFWINIFMNGLGAVHHRWRGGSNYSFSGAHALCTLESIKQEFVNIYRAFNQVKDEVHSFDDKISQYLDGGNGNSKFPALKNLIIAINLIG